MSLSQNTKVSIRDYKFTRRLSLLRKVSMYFGLIKKSANTTVSGSEQAGILSRNTFFPDETFERHFPDAGTFPYRCRPTSGNDRCGHRGGIRLGEHSCVARAQETRKVDQATQRQLK